MNKSKGITLIALIITIIILLILAGITIVALTGENGLIKKANEAKTKTIKEQIKEDTILLIEGLKTDYYVSENDINIPFKQYVENKVKENQEGLKTINGSHLKGDDDGLYYELTNGKQYKVIISDNGEVSIIDLADMDCSKNTIHTVTWTGKNATVSFTTETEFKIQISTDNSNWQDISSIEVPSGTDVYVRLLDGNHAGPSYLAVTPVWKPSITYDINGGVGEVPQQQFADPNEIVNLSFSPTPTREGYRFVGWTTASNSKELKYAEDWENTLTMGNDDIKLFALWAYKDRVCEFIGRIGNITTLTDGNYGKQGTYGALLFDNTHYAIFSIYENVNITFSSSYYSDSGGTTGKPIKVYRLENGQYKLYTTIQTKNNSKKYATHYFTKGTYKMGPPARYVEFSEWDFEIVE